MVQKPIRLRDFIEDFDGRLYAVSAYDNSVKVGCILRYIPDPGGERKNIEGKRFRKFEFDEAYAYISTEKPEYADIIQRVPLSDIARVLKPEAEIDSIVRRSMLVARLVEIFDLPKGSYGCTGSYLCGLENEESDIDLVVYGRTFSHAREILRNAIAERQISPLTDKVWELIYRKRNPELPRDEFLLHEKRKWNRGQIGRVYFDILYARSYKALNPISYRKGRICGKMTVEAMVTDASLSFDNPALYLVDHEEISRILSFSHTYSGQALNGELIQARGICEEHDGERWLVVGTTREAKGEFIRSLSLLEDGGRDAKNS
jgi:predicted nucleotidyltransferase